MSKLCQVEDYQIPFGPPELGLAHELQPSHHQGALNAKNER